MSEDETQIIEPEAEADPVETISREEAENDGWVIVHEDEEGGVFRAEKFMDSNTKIEAQGVTEDKLLESIMLRQAHLDAFESPPAPELQHAQEVGDASRAAADGDEVEGETAPLSVLAPDEQQLTDEEWRLRDSGYEPAEAAMEQRLELSADAENEAKADPRGELDTEQIEIISRDLQVEDNLIVQEGEESIQDVVERKLDQTAQAESERTDPENEGSGGIGPHASEPMGGPSEVVTPEGITEQAIADEHAGQIEAAEAEAAAEMEDAPTGPSATPAAKDKAEELGVDLSSVEGTGADGKIVVSDVEAAAESA